MNWQIVCGDARTAIPDAPVHLVVTSPPYNVAKPYLGHDDELPLDEWVALVTSALTAAWDRLIDGGRLAVNVQHGVGRAPMVPLSHHVEAIGHGLPGALYRGAIVWHKGPVNTTAWGSWLSPSNPVLRGTYELVHVWSKASLSRNGGPGDMSEGEFTQATLDTWHLPADRTNHGHPATFPVALAERLIRLYTWPGDRVLDPFCGIGTSGLAAVRSGRSWIGVDISNEYCRIARQRLTKAEGSDEIPNNAVTTDISQESATFARTLAAVLAEGAAAGGDLAVRRIRLMDRRSRWERYRRTLSNHVTRGAYAVVQLADGSRVCWTTSQRPSHVATLRRWSSKPLRTITGTTAQELEHKLLADVAGVMTKASPDRRTRAITARGFTPSQADTT